MEDRPVDELVAAAQEGDERAWQGLVERFAPLVYSVARRHGLNQATSADVSQTTWLRLAENLDRLREPKRVAGWLATTARNESLSVIRSSKREVLSGDDDAAIPALDDPSGEVLDADRAQVLWSIVRQLSAQCQVLLTLLFREPDLGYRDIAAAIDIPIGSIGPTRARCLAKARALLGTSDVDA